MLPLHLEEETLVFAQEEVGLMVSVLGEQPTLGERGGVLGWYITTLS